MLLVLWRIQFLFRIFEYIYIQIQVNSNDDGGILVGKWNGSYSGGKKPGFWSGSVAILKEYMENRRPVKYGQCWVFAAVATTSKSSKRIIKSMYK